MRRAWTNLKTQSCIFTVPHNPGPVGEREQQRHWGRHNGSGLSDWVSNNHREITHRPTSPLRNGKSWPWTYLHVGLSLWKPGTHGFLYPGLKFLCLQIAPNSIQRTKKEGNHWMRREKRRSKERARASDTVREKKKGGGGLEIKTDLGEG